jgi:ribosomal protein S14
MKRLWSKQGGVRRDFLFLEVRGFSLKLALRNKRLLLLFRVNCGCLLGQLLGRRSQVRGICALSHRSGSVFRYFRLSRTKLRELCLSGQVVGLRKIS